MGAVDTTYTFTATDTITSTKMNNIIDQTTITTDAIIGTTLDVASGKLKVRSAGITSNEMGAASVTQTALAPNVAGNGPAFSAYASSSQSITANTFTKVAINTEIFDTNSNFDASLFRFTPNVAGYYQINGVVRITTTSTQAIMIGNIAKNGSDFIRGGEIASSAISGSGQLTVSSLIYLNGSTDYVELFGLCSVGTATFSAVTSAVTSSFSGFLARST